LLDEVATADSPISEERAAQWAARGLRLTADTRLPIHPRAYHPDRPQVLTTPGFGMFTHFGFHYRYGPAEMANFMLRRERRGIVEYLMTAVIRGNPPKPYLGVPDGYVDVDPITHEIIESVDQAALREASEESGFTAQVRKIVGPLIMGKAVFVPPNGMGRDTLFAWGEEYFIGAHSQENPALEGYVPEIFDRTEKIVWTGWVEHGMLQNPHASVMGAHRLSINAFETSIQRSRRAVYEQY
jgi:8-oxo-dGTP pyrophosphatase MutT (NUDIX family)